MNQYTVLYYPSFHPDPAWLRKILLLTDRVARIVPEAAEPGDPPDLLNLLDVVPDGLTNISPSEQDISLEDISIQRLTKAFAIIAGSHDDRKREIVMTFSKDGSVSVDGHVFVHHSKVSKRISELLQKYNLVCNELGELNADYIVVDAMASDLLLSCVADRIARRYGLDAITDRPLDYCLNALENLGVMEDAGNPEGMLLEAIASLYIPSEIVDLEPLRYRDLRNSYAEVRIAFRALATELSLLNRLGRITDPTILYGRVSDLAKDFVAECDRWRRSRFARGFKSWTPLCVGGLLSAASSLVSPVAAVAVAFSSFAIQVVEKHISSRGGVDPRQRVFQMLVGMRREIIRESPVREIA